MKIQILILAALFPVCGFGQLPESSAQLIKKLGDWELEKQAALEKEIAEKRAAVAKSLEAQLIEVTKSGDLDGALAIKAEIERLTLPAKSTEQKAKGAPGGDLNSDAEMSKSKFAQELEKSKWQWVTANGTKNPDWELEFMEAGKAKFWYGAHDYEIIEPFKIRVLARGGTPESVFTFSRDMKAFSADNGNHGERKKEKN